VRERAPGVGSCLRDARRRSRAPAATEAPRWPHRRRPAWRRRPGDVRAEPLPGAGPADERVDRVNAVTSCSHNLRYRGDGPPRRPYVHAVHAENRAAHKSPKRSYGKPRSADESTRPGSTSKRASRRMRGSRGDAQDRRFAYASWPSGVPVVGRSVRSDLGGSTRRAEPRLTLACGVHKRGHPPGGAGSERRIHAIGEVRVIAPNRLPEGLTVARQLTHQMLAGRVKGASAWDWACLRGSRRAAASQPLASPVRLGGGPAGGARRGQAGSL
jgi:hypothetical protein